MTAADLIYDHDIPNEPNLVLDVTYAPDPDTITQMGQLRYILITGKRVAPNTWRWQAYRTDGNSAGPVCMTREQAAPNLLPPPAGARAGAELTTPA